MLLCQTRFLGNYSCNCFSVPSPLALLTFSTCLISSSDFRNERADIWGGGDQHSTPDSFSSLISIISPCVPVLTEDDLGVPTFLSPASAHAGLSAQNAFPGPCSLFQVQSKFPFLWDPFLVSPSPLILPHLLQRSTEYHMYMSMTRSFFFL